MSLNEVINSMCDEFNGYIGRISQTSIEPKKQGHHNDKSEGFFDSIMSTFDDFGKEIDFEKRKAFTAYNIKTGIYNTLTVAAIASLAGAVFGSPFALLSLVACLAGRAFVNRAMDRTFWGAVGNHHQVTDKNVHSLLFKSFLP